MAFAAIGALIAGAEVTAPLVLGAVAEVGTALTVVGAVTGSKDLMKVGGVMGMVGGVGGLVAGASGAAGAAGSGSGGILSSAINSSPTAATGAADASAVGVSPGSALGQTGDLSNMGSDVFSGGAGAEDLANPNAGLTDTTDPSAAMGSDGSVSPVASVTADGGLAAADTNLAPSLDATPGPDAVSTPAGAVTTPSVAPSGASTPLNVPGAPTGSITNPTDYRLAAGTQASPLPFNNPQDTQTFLQNVMKFMQDPQNKTMLELGGKAAMGLFSGAQKESQFSRTLAYRQAQLAQTSHGSEIGQNRPHGIIQGARA